MALGEVDGKHYGVPTNINLKSMVWYPKDDFDAAGYEVPDDLGRPDRPERPDRGGRRHAVVRRLRERRRQRLAGHRLDGGHHAPHRGGRRLRPVGHPRDPVQRPGGRGGRGERFGEVMFTDGYVLGGAPATADIAFARRPGADVRDPAGLLAPPSGELHQPFFRARTRKRASTTTGSRCRPSTRRAPSTPVSSPSSARNGNRSRGRRLPRAVHRRGRAVRDGRRAGLVPHLAQRERRARLLRRRASSPTPRRC